MSKAHDTFWHEMMEKSSVVNDEHFSKCDFLQDTCNFFGLSHGFIYEADHTGIFHRQEFFQSVSFAPLAKELNMKMILGLELLSELSSQRIIIVSGDRQKSQLEERLKEVFRASTLILIPVLNQHYQLSGFVGLSDRRKFLRNADIDIKTSCAVLSLLANRMKLEMFQKGIAFTEQALGNVLDHIGIDIYVNDYYTHDVLYVNQSMAAPYGGVAEMLGKKCWATIFDDKGSPCEFCPQEKLLDENNMPTKAYTWDYERPFDKSWFRVFSSAFKWTDGRIAHLVASVDITESKRNEMLIQKMARFDHLTGLANRRSLQEDIEALIQNTPKEEANCFLLFCDLDGFKTINDTLSHDAGDVLLTSIGDGLKRMSGESLYCYRQGGDEFVVLVKNKSTLEEMEKVLSDLLNVFCATYQYKGTDMQCGCSVGISHYPKDAHTPKELFHLADTAMYAAKQAGKGTVRFVQGSQFVALKEYFGE